MHGLESGPSGDKVQRLRAAGVEVDAADMKMSIRRLDRESSVVRNLLRDREVQVAGASLVGSVVARSCSDASTPAAIASWACSTTGRWWRRCAR